jgi:hypothetical protein
VLALFVTLQVIIPDVSSQIFVITTDERFNYPDKCLETAAWLGDALIAQFQKAYPDYEIKASAECRIPPSMSV